MQMKHTDQAVIFLLAKCHLVSFLARNQKVNFPLKVYNSNFQLITSVKLLVLLESAIKFYL